FVSAPFEGHAIIRITKNGSLLDFDCRFINLVVDDIKAFPYTQLIAWLYASVSHQQA
ncbi:3065_t:CDS:2, partial [Funneliformis caledonium]